MNVVLFIVPALRVGGAQRSLIKLANYLAQSGTAVTVICMGDSDRSLDTQFHSKIRIVCLGARSSASPFLLFSLWRVINALSPDTVVGWSLYANLIAVLAGRLAGVRRIIVSERIYLPQALAAAETSACRRFALRWLVRHFYRRASVVTANSSLSVRFLRRYIGGPARYRLLPNVIDATQVDADAGQPLPSGLDARAVRPRIVAVGRLHSQKGFDVLIRALKAVAVHRDWCVHIAGDGPQELELRSLAAQLGIAERVRFLGAISNPFPLYKWADIVVVPSRFEGFPNVPLEAMCIGAAVIMSDCKSGPRELTEGGKLATLVPVNDVDSLAAAILSIGSNLDAARTHGLAARSYVRRTYNIDRIGRLYLETFADGQQ